MTLPGIVLVVDAGSRSLHLVLVDTDGAAVARRDLPGPNNVEALRHALRDLLDEDHDVVAVGHRLVQGGEEVREPTEVDDGLLDRLGAVASLAPQHVSPALAAVATARDALPDVPHVLCLDTTFHHDLPADVATYPVPRRWREEYGVRRYGFHGLSYAWATRRAAELLDRPPTDLQLLLAHLGSGSSACAVRHGRSVATSMGMTPLEGMAMGSRSGSVDPGMLLWLQTAHGLSADALSHALEHESGLLGLSDGRSNDTRDLVAAATAGDRSARLALDVYCRRAAQELAAAATSLDRLDALIFTGEIGADQPEVRQTICRQLVVLGVDADVTPVVEQDAVISGDRAQVAVVVVVTGETFEIARQVRRHLTERGRSQ